MSPPALSEREFQAQVVQLARLLGWLVFHPFDSRRSQAGYPDLTLVRERVVWVELKSGRGRLTPQQRQWVEALEAAGAEIHVFRPDDWDAIRRVLD